MFVRMKNKRKMGLIFTTMTALGATIAVAGPYNTDKVNDADVATIPVTIDLKGLHISRAPIYVSIQKRAEYMGIHGHGGVVKAVTDKSMTMTVSVREAGEYAVSVWHDLDNDGVFSMDETYTITDGWGASGQVTTERRPTFDEVKIKVETYGAIVPVTMIYPS